jgi:hypothetical protein
MSTISFVPKSEEELAPEIKAVPTQEIAVVEAQPLAVSDAIVPPVGVEGEITSGDIKPPRLNLVQKTGALGDTFTPGSFVYDKTVEVVGPGKEMHVTVLRMRKYYQQKLAFGDDALPQRFDRADEVRMAGGTTRWSKEAVDGGTYYAETADILLAIEAPEGMDEDAVSAYFPYQHGDKNYGLVVYTITSSAFTALGKRIITDATGLLRDGLWNGQYRIKSFKQVNAQNSWFVPSATFDKKHTPEAAAFFKKMARL